MEINRNNNMKNISTIINRHNNQHNNINNNNRHYYNPNNNHNRSILLILSLSIIISSLLLSLLILPQHKAYAAKRSNNNHRNSHHHHHSHHNHHKHGKSAAQQAEELPCTKQAEEDVDQVFGRISGYGNVSRPFPTDQSELNEYCKGQFNDIRLIESYAKRCKHGLPKQYFSIMLFTVKGSMQRICKNKNSKKARQFLSASNCIRKASGHFDECHRNLIHRLHKIKFTDDKKKIPYTCCEYFTLKKCFQDSGRNEAKCSEKEMETVEELIESTSSNALNFFCGEYADDSDKCEKLGPIPELPIRATSKLHKKTRPKFLRSISLTVAEIFDTFPEISTRN